MKKIIGCVLVIFLFLFFMANTDTELSNKLRTINLVKTVMVVFDVRDILSNFNNKSNNDDVKNVNGVSADDSDNEEDKVRLFEQQASQRLWESLKKLDNYDLLANVSEDDIEKQVVVNNDDWFVIKFVIGYIHDSSNVFQMYYNINKKEEKIMQLGDLFQGDDYINIISEEVKSQISNQISQNEGVSYFEDVIDDFKVTPDHNFYINDKNRVVIVFDKYEIAPGSMGCPEFEIHNLDLNNVR